MMVQLSKVAIYPYFALYRPSHKASRKHSSWPGSTQISRQGNTVPEGLMSVSADATKPRCVVLYFFSRSPPHLQKRQHLPAAQGPQGTRDWKRGGLHHGDESHAAATCLQRLFRTSTK